MTTHSTQPKLSGLAAGLAAGVLLLATASNGNAAPQVGGAGSKLPGAIVLVGKGDSGSKLFRPPQTIKPAPSPRVRDHRGEQQKFQAPQKICFRGGCRDPYGKIPKGNIRDHRSK